MRWILRLREKVREEPIIDRLIGFFYWGNFDFVDILIFYFVDILRQAREHTFELKRKFPETTRPVT